MTIPTEKRQTAISTLQTVVVYQKINIGKVEYSLVIGHRSSVTRPASWLVIPGSCS